MASSTRGGYAAKCVESRGARAALDERWHTQSMLFEMKDPRDDEKGAAQVVVVVEKNARQPVQRAGAGDGRLRKDDSNAMATRLQDEHGRLMAARARTSHAHRKGRVL